MKQVLEVPGAVAKSPVHAEYVAEMARQMIFSQYGAEAYTRGLNVYLTLNSAEQTLAYHALRKGIMDYERRQVYRGPEDYVDLPADPQRARRAHRRSAAGLSRQRRAARRRRHRGLAQEGRGRAAERRRRSTITGEGLKPAASALAAQGQPEDADPARRRRAPDPRRQGRLVDHAAARGRRRVRRDGPAHRRHPRAGRRLRLLEEQVQPRHPGVAPAGLELQAVHLLGGAREGLHAGDGHQRRAALLRRRHHRQPAVGAEELRRHLRRPDDDAARRWPSRRTWCRSASCKSIGPAYAQQWITRFGFDAEKHPAYLPMALGAGAVTPLQMAIGLRRVRQRRLSRQSAPDQPDHRLRAATSSTRRTAAARRIGAHDRRRATRS